MTRKVKILYFAAVILSIVLGSCTPLATWIKSSDTKPQSVASPGQQPKPEVSNAFAYARYVALNLDPTLSKDLKPEEVERILLENSERSKIAVSDMLLMLSAKSVAQEKPEKSTSQLRFEEFSRQLKSCAAQVASNEECCRALAWPMAMLPELTKMEPEPLRVLMEQAKVMTDRRMALTHWKGPNYRLAGLKAWLGACHVVLSKAPQDLETFKSQWASDLANSKIWSRALHPKSRAKRGPRRIYSRNDGQISFAETLGPDCSVTESEVVLRRKDGALDYWVYDASGRLTPVSHFPAPNADKGFKTVEKLAPDSCMGCHYDFETRHFDQLKVSAELLRLPKTSELPLLCVQPGERVVEDN